MTDPGTGILEEAYQRFHATGPEFGGGLSNHGPMAVEAMVRRGHDTQVHAWIDWYEDRLKDVPRGITPVTDKDWQEALGDVKRVGDWTTFMLREVQLRPWRELLAEWWPRLLPGITGGATHGVIRVGHSVRALFAEENSPADGPRIAEFAHALAYWAARCTPLPVQARTHAARLNPSAAPAPAATPHPGRLDPAAALAAIPGVPEQKTSPTHRLSQLADTPGWSEAFDALRVPESARQAAELLSSVIDAAVLDYLAHGHANPVMLVHASTAPTAVLRTLPALPETLWIPSLDAAWLATAAITAAYRNTEASTNDIAAAVAQTDDAREVFDRAVRHRDEHVVKFADTALASHQRTGDKHTLAAATRATSMIKVS